MSLAPSPLYRDPIEDGAADPTIIYNPHEGAWWMVYTNRRSSAPFEDGLAWLFGSALGVASSLDGVHWDYRGTLTGLDVEWGHNTFWAPEIVERDGTFHMFVSYIRGIPAMGTAHRMAIHHYTSPDLVAWTHLGEVPLGSTRVIDACLHDLPGGGVRMWFKDEDRGGQTWSTDSTDLATWTTPVHVLTTPGGHEGPNVFALGGWYWLLVDTWSGQAVYRSHDLDSWTPAGTILAGVHGQAFARPDDVGPGLHADVVTDGERAWPFYFTHPDRTGPTHPTTVSRRSSILVVELTVHDGDLHCDRDAAVDLVLPAPPRPARDTGTPLQ
jgi:beta-xylosidase